jgi:hypothetical protein
MALIELVRVTVIRLFGIANNQAAMVLRGITSLWRTTMTSVDVMEIVLMTIGGQVLLIVIAVLIGKWLKRRNDDDDSEYP